MKKSMINTLLFIFAMIHTASGETQELILTPEAQAVIDLSKQKWQWMADREIEPLAELFDEKAMFVHMGGQHDKGTRAQRDQVRRELITNMQRFSKLPFALLEIQRFYSHESNWTPLWAETKSQIPSQ